MERLAENEISIKVHANPVNQKIEFLNPRIDPVRDCGILFLSNSTLFSSNHLVLKENTFAEFEFLLNISQKTWLIHVNIFLGVSKTHLSDVAGVMDEINGIIERILVKNSSFLISILSFQMPDWLYTWGQGIILNIKTLINAIIIVYVIIALLSGILRNRITRPLISDRRQHLKVSASAAGSEKFLGKGKEQRRDVSFQYL